MKTYIWTTFIQYVRSPYTYISFLLPILMLFGLGKLVPSAIIFPLMISTGYILISLLLFGGSILEIQKKSFIKSLSLTKINKSTLILANVVVASFFMFLLTLISFLMVYLLSIAGWLATDWSAWGPQEYLTWFRGDIDWSNINWGILIYVIIVSVFASFGMAFLIITFTKTHASLYLFSFIYILLMWFLTWLIIPSFFPYGKIDENPSYNFLVTFRYFIPHYWSVVLLNDAINAVPTDLSWEQILIILGDLSIEDILNNMGEIQELIIFLNKYYGGDDTLVYTVFKYGGTLFFGIGFYLVSIKRFSWSVR